MYVTSTDGPNTSLAFYLLPNYENWVNGGFISLLYFL